MLDPTRTEMLRREYRIKLTKLNSSAKRRILDLLEVEKEVNEDILAEMKAIVEEEMGPEAAKNLVVEYNEKFYIRGSEFGARNLRKLKIETVIPPDIILITDKELLDQMNNLSLDLIKGLTEDTKKKLAFELRNGWMQGEGIPKLSNRVRTVFQASRNRAEMIARTESIRVFNTAAVERYKKSGVKKWKWVTAIDERTCSICMPLDGKVFSMGEMAPPPAHPRCRCTVVPVIE